MLLFSSIFSISAQDYFMYIGGEKRYFEASPNEMLVHFAESAEQNTLKRVIEQAMPFGVPSISKTDHKEWHLVNFANADKTKIRNVTQNKEKNQNLHCYPVFINKKWRENSCAF